MNKEQAINLIKGRIMDEYHKHPQLDWAEIAARKLYSQWSEYYADQFRKTGEFDILIKWWEGFRPVGWELNEHLKHPCVNCTTERDQELAMYVCRKLSNKT